MKSIAIALAAAALLSFSATSFASSWDMVGKVLTGIEGARILTGGKFDVIGSVMDVTNIRQDRGATVVEKRVYVVEQQAPCKRVWVPTYSCREEWVPAHWERDTRKGKIFIEGHYVTYKVENGGYWVNEYPRQERYARQGSRGCR
ncbi:MAG: hypothetical protein PHO67_04880 [Candidatus Omnitrophica bacterium]|nr:hypothetical protein [Candidatus Omnitrophota bacterium]MDD5546471.1 hypothetical protein [Candidatus Omnitrophota bacterium]